MNNSCEGEYLLWRRITPAKMGTIDVIVVWDKIAKILRMSSKIQRSSLGTCAFYNIAIFLVCSRFMPS